MFSLRPRLALLAVVLVTLAALPAPSAARWYGSTMHGKVNARYGCRSAAVFGPVSGFVLQPTHQRSCTYRHGGYIGSNRFTFLVPGNGVITKIRIKSGAHPAKLRLTILTASSRVSTFTGRDLPGTYTCCTARAVGRAFRPRANRTTVRRVHVRVGSFRSKKLRIRIHSTDGLALSAYGAGTLPLHLGNLGSFTTGTPATVGFWPATHVGDPRVDGYSVTGMDLLFGWYFRRGR